MPRTSPGQPAPEPSADLCRRPAPH